MLDVLIRGGTLVDGTGAPPRRQDVGIHDGRVVLPAGDEPAAEVLDAEGLVVAPGAVDIHTHYDAQLLWDGLATPSPLHGVTTVVSGNCGFTLAPLRPGDGTYFARMLHRVEGMPLESLLRGPSWDWEGYDDYLGRLDGRIGVNVGLLVGHTALRRWVMGDDFEREATPAEVDQMVALLEACIEVGGLGFSSSRHSTHSDADGRPVPSRFAADSELVALCEATGRHPGTTLEFAPGLSTGFSPEVVDLMTEMSRVANRPLNWNLLTVSVDSWESCLNKLAASDHAAAHGGRIVALTMPTLSSYRINLVTGFLFDALPGWDEVLDQPVERRLELLRDPDVRVRLRDGALKVADNLKSVAQWEGLRFEQTFDPALADVEGRYVGEVAAARGIDPFDCFLDVAVQDGLRTVFLTPPRGDDPESWALRQQVWKDPRCLIGGSDSGAHLDMLDTFAIASTLVGPMVREGKLALEDAVAAVTSRPADLYGIRGRGRVEEGACADLQVFDPERLGPAEIRLRDDLPAGGERLYGGATGMVRVFVNGQAIVADDELTGALPGRVLRSGRDTETVTAR